MPLPVSTRKEASTAIFIINFGLHVVRKPNKSLLNHQRGTSLLCKPTLPEQHRHRQGEQRGSSRPSHGDSLPRVGSR